MDQITLIAIIFISAALALLMFFIIKETRKSRRKVKRYLEHYKTEAGVPTVEEEKQIKKAIKKKEFDYIMQYRKPQLCGAIRSYNNVIFRIVKRIGPMTYGCMFVKKGVC